MTTKNSGSSGSSIISKISKLEKELAELKFQVNKGKSVKTKPKKIEDCESKDQLELFSLSELKDFLKKKRWYLEASNIRLFLQMLWPLFSRL